MYDARDRQAITHALNQIHLRSLKARRDLNWENKKKIPVKMTIKGIRKGRARKLSMEIWHARLRKT